jgi:hypothetical protein
VGERRLFDRELLDRELVDRGHQVVRARRQDALEVAGMHCLGRGLEPGETPCHRGLPFPGMADTYSGDGLAAGRGTPAGLLNPGL